MRGKHAREIAEEISRLGDEKFASRGGQVAREEVSDDLARCELGRGEPTALSVLPVLERHEAGAKCGLETLGSDADPGAIHAGGVLHRNRTRAARVLRGLEDHPAEVEENGIWNVPDRCRVGHEEDATSAG